ncbi:GAF domain-containing protein [Rhodocytophaga aerolata]|uniref:GAF domain-containing protein n=1 Tax=Rhodocytophaga aerolata TaxID=455078 RepID=A0ABT8R6Z4_9BACT|nr:GAF domain-containing protein [Rhodocytophaga aerolata]MDO1447724.1 GAF domain-containing protein [Rhodocytophaga aerolata]
MQPLQEKNYDSEFCGSIPLHLINLIQPHGILLILDKNTFTIVQVSENIEGVLNIPVKKIIGQPLSAFIDESVMEALRSKTDKWDIKDRVSINVELKAGEQQKMFSATLYVKDGYVMMELEENTAATAMQSFIHIYQEVKYIMAVLKEAGNTQEIGKIATAEIKKLSGFDRVMLYQFDKDWNGIVIGEAREPDMEPYLNLRFPASDIPKQSRDLYFKNPYRVIPNRDFTPARLVPVVNPMTKTFTDLSESILRSVPSVHVEYLRNMQVMASMSTAIIIHNKLWGLISCHHKTPLYPGYEMRSAFELLANIISVQLTAKESEKELSYRSQLNMLNGKLIELMYASKDFIKGLMVKTPTLMNLFAATGVSIYYEGEMHVIGNTPKTEQIRELIKWLQIQKIDKVFATDSLPRSFSKSQEYAGVGSGIIALPISYRKGEYVIGFRPEVIQTVDWGGNPNERIQFEPDGKTYHPRNSFAAWKETVKHTSLPWSAQEIEAAESLRTAILERILSDR